MWERCNDALGFPLAEVPRFPKWQQRFPHLQQALTSLGPYPICPPLLISSLSVDALQAVQEHAPNTEHNTNTKNIDYQDNFQGKTIISSWTVSYLKEVSVALINVIKEHGVDDAGWKSVRWEIYDKVSVNSIRVRNYH